MCILGEPHRIDGGSHVHDFVGRGNAGAHAVAHIVQQMRDLPVPRLEQAERREQRRTVRREVGEQRRKRRNRMGLVEAEDFASGVGPVAEAVPDFAFRVLFAAEQHVLVAVGAGQQRDHRLGFRESGQIVKIAVLPIGEHRIAIAGDFGRRRNERQPTAAMVAHRLQHHVAALAVELIRVFHGHCAEFGDFALYVTRRCGTGRTPGASTGCGGERRPSTRSRQFLHPWAKA